MRVGDQSSTIGGGPDLRAGRFTNKADSSGKGAIPSFRGTRVRILRAEPWRLRCTGKNSVAGAAWFTGFDMIASGPTSTFIPEGSVVTWGPSITRRE